MTGSVPASGVDYRQDDEVVVRLSGVPVHSIDGGGMLAEACVPPWTIARVAGRAGSQHDPVYLLAFQHDGWACVAWVPPDLIDGLA
jgi:hypothetical protein